MLTYHKSIFLREDSLVNVPGRAQMRQDNGTHVVMCYSTEDSIIADGLQCR
jgi:hypothetical protein